MALAYLKIGNNLCVIFHCEKVLEVDENNCKALYRLSTAYVNRGDYDNAEKSLKRAMKIEPNNMELRDLAGKIKQGRKDYYKKEKEMGGRVFNLKTKKGTFFETVIESIKKIVLFIPYTIMNLISDIFGTIVNFIMDLWIIKVPIGILKKGSNMITGLINKVLSIPGNIWKFVYSRLPWPLRRKSIITKKE